MQGQTHPGKNKIYQKVTMDEIVETKKYATLIFTIF